MFSSIEEYKVLTKTPTLQIVMPREVAYSGRVVVPHEIMVVKLKHAGEKYVLDLTGAQYGYNQPVSRYSEYKDAMVKSVEEIKSSGSKFELFENQVKQLPPTSSDSISAMLANNYYLSQPIKAVLETLVSQRAKAKGVLEGSDEEFAHLKSCVVIGLAKIVKGRLKKERTAQALRYLEFVSPVVD